MDVSDREMQLIEGFNATITSLVFYLQENELLDPEKLAMVCGVQLEELQRRGASDLQKKPLRPLLGYLHSK